MLVSIPFIAGQWSLRWERTLRCGLLLSVSIPFIAGQWSLLGAVKNPPPPLSCFNPLHCGAVVASHGCFFVAAFVLLVSIPFIAGQWSLLEALPAYRCGGPGFNPLHCGAVVASRDAERRAGRLAAFQSPSLRGSGRF